MPLPLIVLAPTAVAGSAAVATAAYKAGVSISQALRGMRDDRARAETLRQLETVVNFKASKEHVVFTWLDCSSVIKIIDFKRGNFIEIRNNVLLELNIQAGDRRGPISTEVMKAVEKADRLVSSYIDA